MICVRQLSKVYSDWQQGDSVALDAISFEAKRGQIYGLLGTNGAGKTTALRILATVLSPSSGSATIDGCDVVDEPALVRTKIGFVSSNTAIYDRMTAWELVTYFGRLHGLDRELLRERMETLFTRLEMQDFRNVLGAKMSSGMKQKASIARALVHDPPVLIFDEATVGLDVLVGRSLLDTVSALREHGKCIIFSTHIMREAERLCDQIAILHRGRFLAEGSLPELADQFGDSDLEELFFSLIRQDRSDALQASVAPRRRRSTTAVDGLA
ncbi:MAG: ABC transporter ATP-binding protein [Planctomycetaceae bacterium]|nr:ABC transporter ATP-binding protein [Planctomycetaceae bacterium]